MTLLRHAIAACICWTLTSLSVPAEETPIRVVSYNVENYLDQPTGTRQAKSPEAKAKVAEMLLSIQPDVLALQEMGSRSALAELQATLKAGGVDLPHSEWIAGWDTNIHVAVLSRFPLVRRVPHTNKVYLLSGRRLHVSRGFAELEVQVNPHYRFTTFVAHLKSKRPVSVADQSEMRQEEAKLLRLLIDDHLSADADANIVVCGDFNDTYNTPPVKTLVGRGATKLVDLRPAERNGDTAPNPRNPQWFPRNIAWTHHYGVEDTYSRIDFILVSPGMAPEHRSADSYVATLPNWGIASDHRPVVATFIPRNQ